MHLIRIGGTVINLDTVTDIDLDPYSQGPVKWKVGVNFVGGQAHAPDGLGTYDRVFEGSEAAMIMDWCRRNARDVQDWRGEAKDRGEDISE
jgi:hypothetical protein